MRAERIERDDDGCSPLRFISGAALGAGGSVDGDDGAGHVRGHIACQVDKGVRDVLGFADAAQRDGGDQRCDHLLGQRGDHVGLGDSGGDGVHADALGRELAGQALCKAVDRVLGSGVAAAGGLAVLGDHRAGGGDGAAVTFCHSSAV